MASLSMPKEGRDTMHVYGPEGIYEFITMCLRLGEARVHSPGDNKVCRHLAPTPFLHRFR
jgi:hypothetical protein